MDINKININTQVRQNGYDSSADKKVVKADNAKMEQPPDKVKKPVDAKDLGSAVDIANKMLFKNNTHLKFEIHDKTKDVMVKIVNDVTGEVVKEIPPEKMLDMAADLWELAGIIVDERR